MSCSNVSLNAFLFAYLKDIHEFMFGSFTMIYPRGVVWGGFRAPDWLEYVV